jgi:peptidoglycan hydrolase CwlO-like protein
MKPMHSILAISIMLSSLSFTAHASDDKRPDHFKGQASETLEQALVNLNKFNAQLASIVAKGQLEPADMAEIHQLTYTLEAALAKLNDEIEELKDVLEEVHKGSEMMQFERVRNNAERYLSTSQKILKP